MNKSGMGVGSASIVLVFAVLCLSVFSLISLSSATSDRVMTNASVAMVTDYYEADLLAEYVLADILAADATPFNVKGVDILSTLDDDTLAEIVSYVCPISENKELYVEISRFEDTYHVLTWKMREIGEWNMVDDLPVWPGEEPIELWSGD